MVGLDKFLSQPLSPLLVLLDLLLPTLIFFFSHLFLL
jgi:hypothetical protein